MVPTKYMCMLHCVLLFWVVVLNEWNSTSCPKQKISLFNNALCKIIAQLSGIQCVMVGFIPQYVGYIAYAWYGHVLYTAFCILYTFLLFLYICRPMVKGNFWHGRWLTLYSVALSSCMTFSGSPATIFSRWGHSYVEAKISLQSALQPLQNVSECVRFYITYSQKMWQSQLH